VQIYFAKLLKASWAIPAESAIADNDKNIFSGEIGRMTPNGWEPQTANKEIAFLLGACSGCFFRGELVRVIRWPFSTPGYPGHKFEWVAIGAGVVDPWCTNSGSDWVIQGGVSINGGPISPHKIVPHGDPGQVVGTQDAFPGNMTPLALVPPDLTGRPTQFKWCGAEGLFYPIVETPA
jgi:hypothetical protein